MKILSVHIRNFLSYKKSDLSLDGRGLCVVLGEKDTGGSNGAGKSALFESIYWCLFGRTIRDLSPDEIVNNKVKKNCRVSVVLETESGTKAKITRYRGHFEYKNSVSIKYDDHKKIRYGTTDGNRAINLLVGMSPQTFLRSVMLGQGGIFSKPFAECTDKERKDILEYLVLDPEKLKELSQIAKQERNDRQKEIDKIQNDIEVCVMMSAHLSEQITEQKDRIKDWEEKQKKKIKELQKKVDEFSEVRTVPEIKRELDRLEADMSHADKQNSRGSVILDKLNKKLAREEARLTGWKRILTTKKKLIADKNCPTCGQSTKALKKSFDLKILPALIRAAQGDVEDLEYLFEYVRTLKHEFQSEVENSRPIHIDLEAEKEVAIDAAYQRNELEAAIKELNPYTDATDSLRKQLKENRVKKKELKRSKEKKEVELRHWEFWVQAWSDRGIKALILESVLPLLEEYTNYYVSLLADDKLTVTFDVDVKDAKEKFVVKAKNEDGADVYRGNSGGEKQRVDLAIYFALGSISALQQKEPMRTMFIDCGRLGELDEEGLEELVRLLETEVSKKYDTILIVSHMRRVEDLIEDQITIRKIKGVSEVYNG